MASGQGVSKMGTLMVQDKIKYYFDCFFILFLVTRIKIILRITRRIECRIPTVTLHVFSRTFQEAWPCRHWGRGCTVRSQVNSTFRTADRPGPLPTSMGRSVSNLSHANTRGAQHKKGKGYECHAVRGEEGCVPML